MEGGGGVHSCSRICQLKELLSQLVCFAFFRFLEEDKIMQCQFTESIPARILGFHVTPEKTKIKSFKFLPLSVKSHF